jgi:NADH-quinone oxidoreductase subunit M
MKKLIAYSSIAHMGFVTLGMFIGFHIVRIPAEPGRGHGHGRRHGADAVARPGVRRMFLCVGVLYDRMHSREISAYGGVINTMPNSPPSWCCSRWPIRVCRAPPASSASSW